ncbi:hypothetical protein OAD95_00825 [Flavobacteriaceae bacterium]|nr:hypothetical protein [Flavobacteriaceae bacterium]
MKKLILLLLFIPVVCIGQSYKDVMSISSVDMFKKVSIENGYEFDSLDDDGWLSYGFNIIKDSIEGNKASKWAGYSTKNDIWTYTFSKTATNPASAILGALLESSIQTETEISETSYDLITKDIKEKCRYYKILNHNGTDYVTYSCSESSYKGKIGFVIIEGRGVIRHFPE